MMLPQPMTGLISISTTVSTRPSKAHAIRSPRLPVVKSWIGFGSGRQGAEEAHVALVLVEGRFGAGLGRGLLDHPQRVVAKSVADFDALGTAFAVDGVNKDTEKRGRQALPLRHLPVLCRLGKVLPEAGGGILRAGLSRSELCDVSLDLLVGVGDAEYRGVRTGIDAGHAADTGVEGEGRDGGCEGREIA